jgi:hypothetical protein
MKSLRQTTALLFLCSIMVFPRSFLLVKLVCVAFFVLVHIMDYRWISRVRVHDRVLIFYCCVAIGGLVWSLIGLVGQGEPQGIYDSLRLYVGWSAAYLIIVTLLRHEDGLRNLHTAVALSGLLIAAINLFGIYDQYAEIGLFSENILKELRLAIGFHEGYVHITSHNIGSLLFITPYLIAVQFCTNTAGLNNRLTKLSLLACVIVSALSGRRAIWLCVVLTPLIIGLVAICSGSLRAIRPSAQKMIGLMACGLLFAMILMMATKAQPRESGVIILDRLSSAFSSEDNRTIQTPYLVSGFMDSPLFGSGFGAYAGYLVNDESPWLYEATYFQLLFNCGLAGLLFWGGLGGTYFFLGGRVIRDHLSQSGQPLCLIVGLCGFLLGAYSNPYLASFDFLIYVAILPLVASLQRTISNSSERLTQHTGRQEELNIGT